MKNVCRFVLSVIAALALAAPADAQVTTGSLNGKVQNARQEGVAGPNIIAIHLPSGTTYEATSRDDGRFQINNMRVGGPYSVTVAFTGAPAKTAYATEPKSVPVSVTLVTPVGSGAKSKATANAMVIPSVTHVSGLADFRSDVRLANASTSAINYQLIFTPVGQSGTPTTKTTVIQLKAGQTVALDDVVKNFFGFAAAGEAASGPLEIRPLGTSTPLSFASSRTYALSGTGTLGQGLFVTVIFREDKGYREG